jgi:GNAT superfamily N-acetyltransferase
MDAAADIRAATPADREAVLELWLELIEYHRSLDPEYPSALGIREAVLDEICRGIEARNCQILVAERGDTLLGFLFAEIEANPGEIAGEPGPRWIHELFVAPEQRRRGIASALLAEVSRFFGSHEPGRVVVRVESGNIDGLRFWERRGFLERARILERKS